MPVRNLGTGVFRGGSAVRGRVAGSRGLIHNVHLESDGREGITPILAWDHLHPDASQPTANNIVRLWRDGVLEKTVYSASRESVSAIRENIASISDSGYAHYELEPVTFAEDALADSSRAFAVYPQGDRARIHWTECTASDFGAYLVYWNGGTSAPTTLLRTIQNAETLLTTSPKLANGTSYKFALSIRDSIGNATAIGTASSIVADTAPLPLDSAAVSFSPATRRATITGHHPASQHSDIGQVCLYSNYLPGIAFSDYLNVGTELRLNSVFTTSGTVTATTPPLFPGSWRFALRVVDRFGLQSRYDVLELPIKQVGTSLAIGSIRPIAPVGLLAYATSQAGVMLSWNHVGANTSAYKTYANGAHIGTIAAAARTTTITGLTNGTRYTFHVLAFNGGVGSGSSNAATATMDGAAPAGARALTLELVH